MKRYLWVLAIISGILLFVIFNRLNVSPFNLSPEKEELSLPDLQILPPQQLYLEINEETKKIRFSTTVINYGIGPLELG